MGIFASTPITPNTSNTPNFYNSIEENEIVVNFIQLQKKKNCNVTPDQLNMLLGLEIPKYSILENSNYPYVFCVGLLTNIGKIVREYGYEIGLSTKLMVLKKKFNYDHMAICFFSNGGCYELVRINQKKVKFLTEPIK